MNSPTKHPRVRFAPSPTGQFHIGSARTALFNWLFARKYGGVFILRIEDTDRERSKSEFEQQILEALSWLGIDWDEGPTLDGASRGEYGPYRQTQRLPLYRKYLEKLLQENKAYYCYCTKEELEKDREAMTLEKMAPRYIGRCATLTEPPEGKTPQVIRFRTPDKAVVFHDLIRGELTFDASLFGDMVIAKDLDSPLYNFAVVVDDFLMKISHVIRGEDHIANTPKQILLARALEFPDVVFAHLPLILSADRSKMSKRYAETSLLQYSAGGYLPEAIVNFLALLGWHPSHDQEIFSREELIKEFSIERVQKAGAVFDTEKFSWINSQHIKKLSPSALYELLTPELAKNGWNSEKDFVVSVIRVVHERMTTLQDFFLLAKLFLQPEDYLPELLAWKGSEPTQTGEILKEVKTALGNCSSFNREGLLEALKPLLERYGTGNVLWPLRVALSGQKASPDPYDIASVLGKIEVERRIDSALHKISV